MFRLLRRGRWKVRDAKVLEWAEQRFRSSMLELDTIVKRVLVNDSIQEMPTTFITTITALLALHIESSLDSSESSVIRSMGRISIQHTMLALVQVEDNPAVKRALPVFEMILSKNNLRLPLIQGDDQNTQVPPASDDGTLHDGHILPPTESNFDTNEDYHTEHSFTPGDFTGFDFFDRWHISRQPVRPNSSFDESVRDLQSKVDAANVHDADVQRRLQTEAEAKQAAEAELVRVKLQLEEANKPKLPNTVVNSLEPDSIVGSLGGASDNFDDICYPILCSFPVTIYGHSSTNVFVSINGLLSLDAGDRSYSYNLSLVETLGIYYEITGQAPSRTLCVEWYASRYGDSTQYYHFLVILEEARPNLVTHKYLEALDKGAKCTIGAQGPNGAQ
ncbi:hypothetical protein ACHAPQ_007830 [Fusarium lateritium]